MASVRTARRAGGAAKRGLGAGLLMVVRHYPGDFGARLRHSYYRRRLGSLGEGTRIDEGVHIVGEKHVFIGRNCWIAANCFLGAGPPSTVDRQVIRRANQSFTGNEGELRIGDDVYLAPQVLINAHGGVKIGDNVAVSAGARLFSFSHHYRDADEARGVARYAAGMRRGPDSVQAMLLGPIAVLDESFVGTNAVILPGVTIGPRTWLGAGAVARRDLGEGEVYASPGLARVQ